MAEGRSNLARVLGKHGSFASPQQEVFLNLMRTQAEVAAPFDRLFRSHGISHPLYNMLRILRGHLQQDERAGRAHKGVPVLRIGEDMIAREPDMTRLVNRLEKAGLAERHRCDSDRRVVFVRISESGLSLLETLQPLTESLHASQFHGLNDAELKTLNDLLFRAGISVAHAQEGRRKKARRSD